MLTQPELLANLTAGLASEIEWYKSHINKPTGMEIVNLLDNNLSSKAFDPNDKLQESLGVNDAYFSTNYICQVPDTKAPGTLFFSVLVADLVLLQAVWVVFRFIVDTIAQRKDPTLHHCTACSQNMELSDLRNSSSATALMASN